MRDIVFVLFFIIILVVSFRKPFLSLSVWIWSGVYVPVYWLYGFAEIIRYNFVFAASAILSYLLYQNKAEFKANSLFVMVILFFLHTTLTTSLTIVNSEMTWIAWEKFFKIILAFVFCSLIVRSKIHFEMVIWAFVFSIGFFAVVEGLKFLASGGGHHIHGPYGHILADNNHLSLAALMTIPLVIYLISTVPEKWIKIGLILVVIFCVLTILGTKSRGGFLGLLFVGGYFWLKSKRKFLSGISIILLVTVAYHVLPSDWFSRMDTIKTANSDSSFMTRVVSWKIHTLMAMERPLVGGGFNSAIYNHMWKYLALDIDKLSYIPTPPPGDKSWAAHSVYFQVIGDHGFLGFGLFILIIVLSFLKLSSIEKYFKNSWQSQLARMLRVAIVAFCVSGAAVSMAYFELFYVIVGLVVCLVNLVDEEQAKQFREREVMNRRGRANIRQGVSLR